MLLFDIPGKIDEKIEKKKSPDAELRIMGFSLGGKMGFEPTTNGTTNHYSNRLSYIHRFVPANIGLFFELDKIKMLFLHCLL